jgi:hypothetical protein
MALTLGQRGWLAVPRSSHLNGERVWWCRQPRLLLRSSGSAWSELYSHFQASESHILGLSRTPDPFRAHYQARGLLTLTLALCPPPLWQVLSMDKRGGNSGLRVAASRTGRCPALHIKDSFEKPRAGPGGHWLQQRPIGGERVTSPTGRRGSVNVLTSLLPTLRPKLDTAS